MMKAAITAAPAAPVLATDVLRSVRYAPSSAQSGAPGAASAAASKPAKATDAKPDELADLYNARSAEIRSQTAYDETGAPRMTPQARAQMASHLDALRLVNPIAADQVETASARRIEALAAALPRRPDPMIAGAGTAPDLWRPSEIEMRTWARRVDAAEHPENVEARLVDGSITPEDVATYRAVYPERANALEQAILGAMPQLQGKGLSYQRRLALSMFLGRPADPSMDPRILRVLQAQYVAEEGTDGGSQAPRPKPAFGSVRANIATASQEREQALR
jgi:hypothetical protein